MKYGIYIGVPKETIHEQTTALLKILQQLDSMRASPDVQRAAIAALQINSPQNTTISNVNINGCVNEDC